EANEGLCVAGPPCARHDVLRTAPINTLTASTEPYGGRIIIPKTKPAIPVVETCPPGIVSPKTWVSWSNSPQVLGQPQFGKCHARVRQPQTPQLKMPWLIPRRSPST